MSGRKDGSPEAHYLLGHTDHELQRLDLQGEIYHSVTRRALEAGGIREGSRVLDIGCGTGDVSLAVAERVGPSGQVLGIDRGEAAVSTAQRKFEQLGVTHARFEQHELDAFDADEPFDAVVGRFILMHQPDPAATLAAVSRSVRPGGTVIMIESWMNALRGSSHSYPHSRFYDGIVEWKSRVVEGAGADLDAGGRLRATYRTAGIEHVETWLEALVAGERESPYYAYVEQSVRSMLPEAARQGLGGFDDDSTTGIAERLRNEVDDAAGALVAWPVVVAVGRVAEAG